jgi:hypothetical protein
MNSSSVPAEKMARGTTPQGVGKRETSTRRIFIWILFSHAEARGLSGWFMPKKQEIEGEWSKDELGKGSASWQAVP